MLFSKQKLPTSEEGFLLIQVVIILSLFLSLELSLFYSLSNIQTVNTSKKLSINDNKILTSNVGGSKFDALKISSLGKTEIYNFGYNQSKALEIFYKNKLSPLSPSFEFLESLPKNDCPLENKKLFSSRTCSNISADSYFISGNLVSEKSEEVFSKILFVKGEIDLKELILSSNQEVFTLISLGNIKINKLKLKNSLGLKKAILFSQTGKIEIESLDSKFNIGTPKKNSLVQLSLVSSKLKKAGTSISEKPGIFGEDFNKPQHLWPKELVIASKVN